MVIEPVHFLVGYRHRLEFDTIARGTFGDYAFMYIYIRSAPKTCLT